MMPRMPRYLLARSSRPGGVGRLLTISSALVLAAWLLIVAWVETRFTSFAWAGETLCFRSSNGWMRRISLVRAGRVQVVAMQASPLDRRWAMKRVIVDTAGAADAGHKVEIPWLAEDVADALYARLRHAAAGGGS